LSGRGLCDEPITRPEESYRLWCEVVCDLEFSRMRRPWLALGRSGTAKTKNKKMFLRGTDVDLAINILRSTTCAYNLTSCKISHDTAAVLHLQLPDWELIAQPSWRRLTCYKIASKNLRILPKSIIMNLPDQVHVARNSCEISGSHHRVVATRGAAQIPCARTPLRLNFVTWCLTLWVVSMEIASCYPSGT
jgi:hypothetical protein